MLEPNDGISAQSRDVAVFKTPLKRDSFPNVVGLMEACGREISWHCIWQGHGWAWGNVRVEALLTSRMIYEDRRDVEHLCAEGKKFLQEGLYITSLAPSPNQSNKSRNRSR